MNSAFWCTYIYIYIYRDIQKSIQVFILLTTVHNKAILTLTVIQVQYLFHLVSTYLFVNKALVPPPVLLWHRGRCLAICQSLADAQEPSESSNLEWPAEQSVWPALCCVQIQLPPPGHSRSIFAHPAQLDTSADRNLLLQRAFLGLTCVSPLPMELLSHQQAVLNYKE